MECLLLKLYHNATKKDETIVGIEDSENVLKYDYSNDKRQWATFARISDWEKENRKAKREARKIVKPQKCGANKKQSVGGKHLILQHERNRIRRMKRRGKK